MRTSLSLSLPRDAMTIPVARRICASAMQVLGVTQTCIDELVVAISEACTNVLDHVEDGDEYDVVVSVDDQHCEVEVIDRGYGFAAEGLGHRNADTVAEGGRGIQLIRALMDSVAFQVRQDGASVHMVKTLQYEMHAPGPRLRQPAAQAPSGQGAPRSPTR